MLGTVTLLVMSASFFNPSFALSSHFDSGRLFYICICIYVFNARSVMSHRVFSKNPASVEMRKMLLSVAYEELLE